MPLFAQSVFGAIDLRQREGTSSAGRHVVRAGPIEAEPATLPRPKIPPVGASDTQSPANGGGGGNRPQVEPAFAPAPKPNKCLEEGSKCAEIIDKASELIKELGKKLADAVGSTTTSNTFATVITPAPLPNYDIITAIDMYEYLPLLNTAEQQMWNTDPLCFFANIEGYYTAAASSSAAASTAPTTTSSAAGSTTASVASSASLLRRDSALGNSGQCEADPSASGCPTATTTSSLPALSFSSVQSDFFSYYLPSALVSAYGAPRNGSLSTGTTTCSGLHSSGSVTATYVLKAAATGTGGTSIPPAVNTASRDRLRISVSGVGFLGGLVAFLMM